MFKTLSGVWALLLGILLIMLGNGMHFTLIGLRGVSDGAADLHHYDDWTQYLHVIDEKLADAVDRVEAALESGLLG